MKSLLCSLSAVFLLFDGYGQVSGKSDTGRTDTAKLHEVIVRGDKTLYRQRPEGMVVNVESSVLTRGSSALEVLERSPGVIIDHRNNSIALNGKNGVLVMINGKLMRMPVEQLVILLGTMSANDIERIELLTTPPSSYDAEGSAGIINIVLKKNRRKGTNGSASLTTGYGYREKGTASVNLAHNGALLNTYGSYTFSHDRPYNELTVEGSSDFPTLGGHQRFLFNNITKPLQNNHNVNAGLDARINTKTSAGASITYGDSRESSSVTNQAVYTLLPDSVLLFNGDIRGRNSWRNLISTVYLEKQIKESEKINLSLDYLRYRNQDGANVQSSFINQHGSEAGAGNPLYAPRQRTFANTVIGVGVLKIDYSRQLDKKIKLETGIKAAYTESTSSSAIESLVNGQWVGQSAVTNHMRMKEGIGALYTAGSMQIDAVTQLVIGARYEYSRTRLNDAITGLVTVDRKLGVFFPNLFFSRKLTENADLHLSYSKRISRPSYSDLASFVGYSDPTAVLTGNSSLRPTITNNLKLGYNYRGYSFSLLLSRDDYPIARYQLTESPGRDLLYVSPQNLSYQNNLNLQVSLPIKITRWWDMSYGFVGGWRKYKEDYTRYPLEMTFFGYSANFRESFRIPAGISLEISGWYNGAGYNGTTRIEGFGALNAGIKKEFAGNGGILQLAVGDILRTQKVDGGYGSLTEEAYAQHNHFQWRPESVRSTILKLTYSRSFGSGTSNGGGKREGGTGSAEERERVRNN